MGELLGLLAGFIIVVFAIVIAIYIAQAIFLNKFNKMIYGKGTPMAWIPVANIYLLGKLAINKTVGYVLVLCCILTMEFSVTVNGVKTAYTILPKSISSIITPIYSLAVLGLFIYAIVKYFKFKKKSNQQSINNNQQF